MSHWCHQSFQRGLGKKWDLIWGNGISWPDYYFRFTEIAKLDSVNASAVILHCNYMFARHGVSKLVQSDNGPQFLPLKMSEVQKCARYYRFQHQACSPQSPQRVAQLPRDYRASPSTLPGQGSCRAGSLHSPFSTACSCPGKSSNTLHNSPC